MRPSPPLRRRSVLPILMLAVLGVAQAQEPKGAAPSAMLDILRRRVEQRPEDSQSWRLLGKALQNGGESEAAREAYEHSLQLEPANAAAHFDLGKTLIALGEPQLAANRLARVVSLVPGSDYAREAEDLLEGLPTPQRETEVALVSYEIRRFDGSEITEELEQSVRRTAVSLPPVSIRVETGALYNSNVALTPTTRNFAASGAGSPQGVFNPNAEIRLLNTDDWRAGPLLTGYFTVNNSDFSGFNLQSYMGGAFVERSIERDAGLLVPRAQYTYTLDQFDGNTFGQRHSFSASLTELNDDQSATTGYFSVDHTDLMNDGATPSISSQDGWTSTLGGSHTWWIDRWWLRSTTLGADVQRADLRGSDFSYNGVTLYGSAVVPVTDILNLILDGGWGYRDYFDAPSTRNQVLWRGGSRLELALTEHWKVAGVFTAEAFESDTASLNASRLVGGVVAVYQY